MTAMQLNNMKLDIIGMVMDTDDEQLLSKVVSCFNSTGDFKPMTMAEYREKIRLAEEDFAAGRVLTNEEMGRWINQPR